MIKRKKGKPVIEIDIKIRESGKAIDSATFNNRNLLDEYLNKFSLIGGKNEKNKFKLKK